MLSAAVCLSAGAWPSAAAEDVAATEQVQASLAASVDAVYPDAEILLGVRQRIIPHWHTYWVNPGDSGLATQIRWELPDGAQAGEILWPTPQKIGQGPVVSYGYENEATLLVPVKVPHGVRPGEAFRAKAKVRWLVCEETCIPQEVELGLTLPVVADRAGAGEGSPIVRAARERLPRPLPWKASFARKGDRLILRVAGKELTPDTVAAVDFYPAEWGRLVHNRPPEVRYGEDGVSLEFALGEAPPPDGQALRGVLAVTENGPAGTVAAGYALAADFAAAAESPASPDLPLALGLALLGGLILNLMPCVFPVLALKALHLLRQADASNAAARRQGIAYAVGVSCSFAALGVALTLLKAAGAAVGWGFQLQSPWFVTATAYTMLLAGLNLSGVFVLRTSVGGAGTSLAARDDTLGSFFSGVLASLVAAPCTAPFMGAAIGYAIAQPVPVLFAVLFALGAGLSLPYLALSHWPALRRLLPRPGAWMEVLKQALAFPMYASAAWLIWVLAQQRGADAAGLALGGAVAIAFAAWLWEMSHAAAGALRIAARGSAWTAAILTLGMVGGVVQGDAGPARSADASKNWAAYSPQRFEALRARGEPVFLNFTAAWCISCLVNERVALGQTAVQEAFRAGGIAYLKGDWTDRDETVTAKLREFGRSGVPLYVFYPPGAESAPAILPQILTPDIVLDAIRTPAVPLRANLSMQE